MSDPTVRPGPGSASDRARAMARREAPDAQSEASAERDDTLAGAVDRPAVVLIGPPGSGKSSVGAAIARATGLALRDTDNDIEQMAGKSIPDIFTQDGEPHFRDLERTAVRRALGEHRGVLALGGGAILAPETRAILAGAPVVFLSLSMSTGVRRTGLASNRPLLAGLNPRATYKALLDARLPLYREIARHEVETDNLSVAEVARIIIEKLELA
ncbi:shikimate kinase [Nakamurella panacisegetis]|uniref:Shikimate kinase n=1 Tax=Nakamurella panacisegetis TaxID=1090615 RepID=A0A1H0I8V6_9ACTN|nr:shikimate kinase [Nakamurella panacisegetis]SDO27894.1 shikimate kinase [Nakamurella panacisegetis]